jgi:hypothetical protein
VEEDIIVSESLIMYFKKEKGYDVPEYRPIGDVDDFQI